jgi:hypothetical protein
MHRPPGQNQQVNAMTQDLQQLLEKIQKDGVDKANAEA